jgi:hypothetical protein
MAPIATITRISPRPGRAINWLESTSRSLRSSLPDTTDCAEYVTERLAALMLDRLPPEVSRDLLDLLPDESLEKPRMFRAYSNLDRDASIAFPQFIERARHALGLSDLLDSPKYADSEGAFERLSLDVAEAFLWAVASEFPMDLKDRMSQALPSDLRCRMNLYCGYSDSDKVA